MANAGDHEILAVDDEGSVLWRAGGEGMGPGEFQSLARLGRWRGDTLVALDPAQNRASFWTGEGKFLRTSTATPGGPSPSPDLAFFKPGELIGVLQDGSLVFRGPETASRLGEPGLRRVRTPLTIVHPDGTSRAPVELPGPWMYELAKAGPLPALLAPMTAGTPLAIRGDDFAWARTDKYEVVVFDVEGHVKRILRIDKELQRLTAAERSRYSDNWSPWFSVDEPIPFPSDEVPSLDRIFFSAENELWARRYNWGGAPSLEGPEEWIRLDTVTGRIDGFRFPDHVRVLAATTREAYGVWRDELDVEHVERFLVPSS